MEPSVMLLLERRPSRAPEAEGKRCQLAKTSAEPARILLLLLLLLLLQTPWAPTASAGLADFDGATFYKAPVGSRVRIACNGSHWSDESVSLVLWFKGASGGGHQSESVPIYTVDARQRPLSQGARHLVADQYKGRARFNAQAQPPYLDLSPLEADDQAEYRCRIDYRSRPRENFLVILFVLVPPHQVQIMDAGGRSLGQIYGPLGERSDLTLVCLSKGGRPAPALRWRRDRKVIDDSYLTINDYLALARAGRLLESQPNSSSSNLGQLRSLWADWGRWPEHQLLAAELGARPQPQSQWTGSGSAALGLLGLGADPNASTAANALQLANLPQSLGPGEGPWRLECEASNLHYDLRALIRLFAPPSLAAQDEPKTGADPARSQLVAAIERALDVGLAGEPAGGWGSAEAAARQVGEPAGLTSSPSATSSAQDEAGRRAHLLGTELLARPHQLAADASESPADQQLVRSRLIALDIYLRPRDVRILSPPAQRPLSAGQLTEFVCQSKGSRPAARISWWRQRRPLEPKWARQLDQNASSQSVSRLSVRLEPADNGKELTCRATNEQLARGGEASGEGAWLEETRILNVQYAPRLKLEPGNAKLSTEIRAGQDIFFVCHSDANPAARDLQWLHERRPLANTPGGPIVSNNSLVLQRVRPEQSGRYACVASNSEGIAESNQLELRVLHPPACALTEAQTRQVPPGASVLLECPMLAEPPVSERRWRLESVGGGSGGGGGGGSRALESPQLEPQLEYRPETALDYGRLSCEASNALGAHTRACLYDIVPPPDPPPSQLHCLALNATSQTVGVVCPAGLRPGQVLELELRRRPEGERVARLRAGPLEEPYFALGNLQPATNYSLRFGSTLTIDFSTSAGGGEPEPTAAAVAADQPQVEPFAGARPALEALISTRSAGDQSHTPKSAAAAAAAATRPHWWPSVLDGLLEQSDGSPNSSGATHRRRPPINKLMEPSTRLLITSGLLLALLLASSLLLLLLARRRWLRRQRWKRAAAAANEKRATHLSVDSVQVKQAQTPPPAQSATSSPKPNNHMELMPSASRTLERHTHLPDEWPSSLAGVGKSRSALTLGAALGQLADPNQSRRPMTLLGARLISDADFELASECQRQQLPGQQQQQQLTADNYHFDRLQLACDRPEYDLPDFRRQTPMIGPTTRAVVPEIGHEAADEEQELCTWTSSAPVDQQLFIQLYANQSTGQELNFAHLNIVADRPLALNNANTANSPGVGLANSLKCPSLASSASFGSSSAGFGCNNTNKDQSPLSLTNTTLSNNTTTESLLLNLNSCALTCPMAHLELEQHQQQQYNSANNPNGSHLLTSTLRRQQQHVVYAKPQTQPTHHRRSHYHQQQHHQQQHHHQQHIGAPTASKSILKNRHQQQHQQRALELASCQCDKEIDNDADQDKTWIDQQSSSGPIQLHDDQI